MRQQPQAAVCQQLQAAVRQRPLLTLMHPAPGAARLQCSGSSACWRPARASLWQRHSPSRHAILHSASCSRRTASAPAACLLSASMTAQHRTGWIFGPALLRRHSYVRYRKPAVMSASAASATAVPAPRPGSKDGFFSGLVSSKYDKGQCLGSSVQLPLHLRPCCLVFTDST